ncbi:OmpA family protein [Thermomonas sp. HDW16]|uniref:OmpA family protein n=1 Tax=Thermomonas sp. HDW16 TaxID=2714945 RepID=UPI0014098BF1|nr:OmpA family protein [Thermomonas sp. HDW16]QIL19725.1 OmpA family protein [Thermomonas sp. HDW16]
MAHAKAWLSLAVMAALVTAGCKREQAPPAPAQAPVEAVAATTAPTAPDAAATPAPTAGADFDPASVPESTATLPPFPFFKIPDGLESVYAEKDKNVAFDRHYFIAGDKAIPLEGRLFHDKFNLTNEARPYSDIEFRRNYENAINALGGKKINTSQYTYEVMDAAGGRDALEKTNYAAGMNPDYPHDIYLLRQGGKEWWIDVSTGAFPLHGFVVVLEKEGMKQSLALLDAAAMKQAIDKEGRVALHINFDTDKATLRPDAQPTIDEIHKLLSGDPALKLSIEGHTDNTGTPTHNQELSAARARSVLGALVGLGIDPARLSSKGFGQDKPVADNAGESGRAENRRVELVKAN